MDFDDISKNLPPNTSDFIQSIWHSLSPSDRESLSALIKGLPDRTRPLQSLIKLGATHLKTTFGHKKSIIIVGPANVGKSTLYNQFVLKNVDRADVGPIPGTTRKEQSSDAGLFSIIDTPGADAAGYVGEKERDIALQSASGADFLIMMFDAIQGIKQTEIDLYYQLLKFNKPYIVVLNKMDLVGNKHNEVVDYSANLLHLDKDQIIPIEAKSGVGINKIVGSILMSDPAMVTAMGRALPQYRWQLAWRIITNTASLSAAIALTPLPVIDFIPLVISQAFMVVSIARIYNYRITFKRAGELLATFGIGFIGRSLFYELIKLGGIPGWLLSAAIASSTTAAMGYAASIWFDRGERISGEALKKITKDINQQVLNRLRNIGKKKPTKKVLQQQVKDALDQTLINNDDFPIAG